MATLPHVSPHSIMRGFGSLLHGAGVPIAHISALLAHADESFTYRTWRSRRPWAKEMHDYFMKRTGRRTRSRASHALSLQRERVKYR